MAEYDAGAIGRSFVTDRGNSRGTTGCAAVCAGAIRGSAAGTERIAGGL